ncbi:MAG: hypothetical protein AAF078_00365 [Planctomycetota bacterium]
MPVILLTLHAYGTWLPDRPQGYVRRDTPGVLPSNTTQAERYRKQMHHPQASFGQAEQHAILTATINAAALQNLELHAAATDITHAHLLISWRDDRPASHIQRSLKRSISTHLNTLHRRPWLSRGGHIQPIQDRAHLDHLRTAYLPKHTGLQYSPTQGIHP